MTKFTFHGEKKTVEESYRAFRTALEMFPELEQRVTVSIEHEGDTASMAISVPEVMVAETHRMLLEIGCEPIVSAD